MPTLAEGKNPRLESVNLHFKAENRGSGANLFKRAIRKGIKYMGMPSSAESASFEEGFPAPEIIVKYRALPITIPQKTHESFQL